MLCQRKNAMNKRMGQPSGLDTRNLLSGINDHRPTVKVHRNNDLINSTLNSSKQHKHSKAMQPTKLKGSRIELWNEKEVVNLMRPKQNQAENVSGKNVNASQSAKNYQKSLAQAQRAEENKNHLIQIFKEFKLNPYLSPLLNQLQTHHKLVYNSGMDSSNDQNSSFNDNSFVRSARLDSCSIDMIRDETEHKYNHRQHHPLNPLQPPDTPHFYRKNMPANPPVTPLLIPH